MPVPQRPLICQEGRAPHEKHRKCRQADIGHGILAVAARSHPLVRQPGADLLELANQLVNQRHPEVESHLPAVSEPPKWPKPAHFPRLWHDGLTPELGPDIANAIRPH